jgi:hypothetical protein
MTINDFSFGQEVYVLILGLPQGTAFSERCRKGRVTDIKDDSIAVTTDTTAYHFAAKTKFHIQDDYYVGISYKLFLCINDVYEYLNANDMYNDVKWAFDKPYSEFESTFSVEHVKSIHSLLYPDKMDPINWTAHYVGTDKERYNASVKEFAFLITFVIEKVDDKWFVVVSGAGNAQNTVHAREYEMSSRENTLDEAMEQSKRFYTMMYHMFKEDFFNA